MASPCSNTCPVCLRELRRGVRGELGKPENCNHLFCFTCIHEWAKNVNNCPVDRIPFNNIEVLSSRNHKLIKKVYVADHTLEQVLRDPNDMTCCEICHQGDREDQLLLCDGCDRGYHLECLTPPLDDIPEGDWYCSQCEAIMMSQYISSFEDGSPVITSEDSVSICSSDDEDWSSSQCEVIGRPKHIVIISSDEESSASFRSEVHSCISSTDDELVTFQHRRRTGNAPHRVLPETDSEEENSDSSLSSIVHCRRIHSLRRLDSESFSSGEDDEAPGDQPELDSEGSSVVPGTTRGKRRVLDSDSDDSEWDMLVHQPSAKKRCSSRYLSNPSVVLQKVEDICSSECGSLQLLDRASEYKSTLESGSAVADDACKRETKSFRRLSTDEDDTSNSVAEPIARKGKRQISLRNILPDSDVEMSEVERSTSPDFHLWDHIHHCEARSRNGRVAVRERKGKGKEPASSSRRAKKKVFSHEAPQPKVPLSSDSDTASIHSGYCSPYECTLTGKESYESSWEPSKHLKVIPMSSPQVTRQRGIQNVTSGWSESKIQIDDAPAERRSLRSAKSNVQNEGLPDDFEEKVLGSGRSKRSNTNKGTKRKQSRRRKIRRRNVKSTRGSSARRDRSVMRNHSRSKKKRRSRKKKAKADADPDFSPDITLNDFTPRVGRSRECVQTRSRARTAATHSPRDPTIRAAIIEAYRHENATTGLQQAQALLKQRRESLQITPLRYRTAAAIYGHTPTSGYNTPFDRENKQQDSLNSKSVSVTPLSGIHKPAGDGLHYGRDEVQRRTIPRRKLSSVALSYPSVHPQLSPAQEDGGSVSRKTISRESSSASNGDLLGKICQSLNDLQKKTNIIKRDGSIIPIYTESSPGYELTPTREPRPSHRHGNSKGTITSVTKGGHSKALPKSWGSDIYKKVPPETSCYTGDYNCTADTQTHTRAARLKSRSWNHDHRQTHKDLCIKSAFSSDLQHDKTRQDNTGHSDQSNPSNNKHAQTKTLVKDIVKGYYKARKITDKEYWRILEKATEKVLSGRQPVNEGRVRRLIADYVEGYKSNRRTFACNL